MCMEGYNEMETHQDLKRFSSIKKLLLLLIYPSINNNKITMVFKSQFFEIKFYLYVIHIFNIYNKHKNKICEG